MVRALVQSARLPAAVVGDNHGRLQGSGKSRKTVKMICNSQTRPRRLRRFTGSCCDFHSKVATAISVPRGKASRGVAVAMFEWFSERAIKVIMLAQEEARRLGHNAAGTEQILLGLIRAGTGIAAKVLKSMGINVKDARSEVEKIIGRGSGFVSVEISFSLRAKRVLETLLEDARQLGHNFIGTEHLLLQLVREGECIAIRVLVSFGADRSNIRSQVTWMVGESTEAVGASVGGGSSGNKIPTLEVYSTNLTSLQRRVKTAERNQIMGHSVAIVASAYLREMIKSSALIIISPIVIGESLACCCQVNTNWYGV